MCVCVRLFVVRICVEGNHTAPFLHVPKPEVAGGVGCREPKPSKSKLLSEPEYPGGENLSK